MAFSFGNNNDTNKSNTPAPAGGFSFGGATNASAPSTGGFSFGDRAAAAAAPSGGFSFGANTATPAPVMVVLLLRYWWI